MVNDDIEQLNRFGSQLKQIQPPQQKIKEKEKEKHHLKKNVNGHFILFLKKFKRYYKSKKMSFFMFLSYQMNCLKMKQLKNHKSKVKDNRSSTIRLIEKKYQIFNRTILIRQRKRIYQSESNQGNEQILLNEKQQSLVYSPSNLFDIPMNDE